MPEIQRLKKAYGKWKYVVKDKQTGMIYAYGRDRKDAQRKSKAIYDEWAYYKKKGKWPKKPLP